MKEWTTVHADKAEFYEMTRVLKETERGDKHAG